MNAQITAALTPKYPALPSDHFLAAGAAGASLCASALRYIFCAELFKFASRFLCPW